MFYSLFTYVSRNSAQGNALCGKQVIIKFSAAGQMKTGIRHFLKGKSLAENGQACTLRNQILEIDEFTEPAINFRFCSHPTREVLIPDRGHRVVQRLWHIPLVDQFFHYLDKLNE